MALNMEKSKWNEKSFLVIRIPECTQDTLNDSDVWLCRPMAAPIYEIKLTTTTTLNDSYFSSVNVLSDVYIIWVLSYLRYIKAAQKFKWLSVTAFGSPVAQLEYISK